jgi:hypothetical protein
MPHRVPVVMNVIIDSGMKTRKKLPLLIASLLFFAVAFQFFLPLKALNRTQDTSFLTHQHQDFHNANVKKLSTRNVSDKKYNDSPVLSSSFCFVHVGKTAGGTISCRLSARLGKSCPKESLQSRNGFTRKALGKLHKNKDWGCTKNRKSIPKIFLFALRDPVERIRSWFTYEHPRLGHVQEMEGNRPYLYNCFDTLDELSRVGLQVALHGPSSNNGSSLSCAQRAWKAITGQEGFQYHNAYNYQYYFDWATHIAPTNMTIMAIRSEHLEEDWNRLQKLYGQPVDANTKYFESVQRHASHGNVTWEAQVLPNLCLALCEEIHLYQHLLQESINLTPQQKSKSLEEMETKCPNLPVVCPSPHPTVQNHEDKATWQGIPSFSKLH